MARSILTSTFRFLSGLVDLGNNSTSDTDHISTSSNKEGPRVQAAQREGENSITKERVRSGNGRNPGDRKRKAVEDDFERLPKRRTVNRDRSSFIPYDNYDDHDSTSSLEDLEYAGADMRTKAEIDRTLMPPPATPHRSLMPIPRQHLKPVPLGTSKNWLHDEDSISFASSGMPRRKPDDMDGDLMEEARRHAAAVTLPVNSGIWSQTERELFFHLAYRGFEPLLPQNWMIDFDTLPISLFAHENTGDPPLIQNIRDNQFRAGHALRRLFEAGHDVRDRNHVSPGSRREKILEQAVKRYLYWALTDIGLRPGSNADYIPVHVVATRRKGRSTLHTLEDVAEKLHKLSERHRRARDIQPSIETRPQTTSDGDDTRVIDDDKFSPTFIGLVIISSVLVIVTLSPFSLSPPLSQQSVPQTASPPNSDPDLNHPQTFNPDRLRIIAELDFSQRDQDVWNALGVAIVAMQVRSEALKANFGFSHDDLDALGGDAVSIMGSKLGDELEERFGSTSKLDFEDDPDL
ncbi:uncharacterized protein Z518_03218 [Rhinocladiella mackenziei CBS 650.93]|uniref:Uncharacterized protein n=1 Tax=Rhinocladiella mackenziei CBS 650.93 TaxID=1442369 RepID=A0A0D2G251_9EURO|nr:uncharacterized protein Z518_03218 [Rhinocladiella mackenziei CBS 650.93]KIX08562.1 hypothetical protein Z518_03218 [Rhinocladiella mackenziei CBS 650.93]